MNWGHFKLGIFLFILLALVASLIVTAVLMNQSSAKYKQQQSIENKVNNKSVKVVSCAGGHENYQLSSSSNLGKYKSAAVAVDSNACSQVGKDILAMNGSAVDAAIATGLCDGLFNAQSMGIGGGHFMLIYIRSARKMYAIDSRETAPLYAKREMFVKNPKASFQGGLASAIPGEIAGYWEAHKIGGRLPWKTLFQPTIKYCKNGFVVSDALAKAIEQYKNRMHENKGLANVFVNKTTNETYKANETMKMEALAKTLEIISEHGSDEFYKGSLTKAIVRENNENGGIFQMKDLVDFKPATREPIEVTLSKKYRLFTMPAPSSGLLISFILSVMSHFNLTQDSLSSPDKTAVFYHRLTEAFKHAFAKRSFLGDSDFVNMTEITRNLTNLDNIKNIVKKIDDSKTFNLQYYEPGWSTNNNMGTAQISVVAPDGDAVSLTSTVNTYFGAKYAGEETGIIYNNEMNDFSSPGTSDYFGVPASEANFIEAGKRPMSSMAPIIVLDEKDDVRLVLGASGGTRIITSISQVALRNLFLGKNIKESIDELRAHHQLLPEMLDLEEGFNQDVKNILIKKGHQTKCSKGGSAVQGVERRTSRELWANSDFRKSSGGANGF